MSAHNVTPDEAGRRADVLVARLAGAARSLVSDAVKRGDVRVNGVAVRASHPLEAGDLLEFEITPRAPLVALPEEIDIPIVYEDDDLLIVDKPAGMVTHPAHGATSGTLVNALLAHIGTLPGEALRAGPRAPARSRHVGIAGRREDAAGALGARHRDEEAPHQARVSRPRARRSGTCARHDRRSDRARSRTTA